MDDFDDILSANFPYLSPGELAVRNAEALTVRRGLANLVLGGSGA